MEVTNVKVKYIRPKGYKNLKEWMSDSRNIYIGRSRIVFIDGKRFPPENSIFSNPFRIRNSSRGEVIQKYENYLRQKIKDANFLKLLLALNGKNLGCWCKPKECHGDIIIKIINENVDSI